MVADCWWRKRSLIFHDCYSSPTRPVLRSIGWCGIAIDILLVLHCVTKNSNTECFALGCECMFLDATAVRVVTLNYGSFVRMSLLQSCVAPRCFGPGGSDPGGSDPLYASLLVDTEQRTSEKEMHLSEHAFQMTEMCELFGGRKLQVRQEGPRPRRLPCQQAISHRFLSIMAD